MTLPSCLIPTPRTALDPIQAGDLTPGDVIVSGDGHPFEVSAVVDHGSYVHLVGSVPYTNAYIDVLKDHVFDRLGRLSVPVTRC